MPNEVGSLVRGFGSAWDNRCGRLGRRWRCGSVSVSVAYG